MNNQFVTQLTKLIDETRDVMRSIKSSAVPENVDNVPMSFISGDEGE